MGHFTIGGVVSARISALTRRLSEMPLLRLLIVLLLVAALFELNGIRSELNGIREEQVKNAAYTLRPEVASRLRANPGGQARLRILAAQTRVTVDNAVKIDGPIEVEAAYTLPVEIQEP